jgi:predicted enzyme related to lactoylglutathione lyase
VGLQWEQITVDAKDPAALAAWWNEVLDWNVVDEDPDVFEIRPESDFAPGLLFLRVPEPKTVKNRLHIDLRPTDQAAEVARLLGLGATQISVGEGDVSWVVMADPEGNEFCVLRSQ